MHRKIWFCNTSPLKTKFGSNLRGSVTISPTKQRERGSSLCYWSLEKKRSGSIIGYLQVKTFERQQAESLVEEFKIEADNEKSARKLFFRNSSRKRSWCKRLGTSTIHGW